MFVRSAVRWSVLLVASITMSGCYTYALVPASSLSLGVQARLRLDQDGFGRVVNQAAMNSVPPETIDFTSRGVVGRVVATGSESVTVQLRGVGGAVFDAQVPVVSIEESALRRFSTKRSVLAVTGVVALVTASFATGWIGGTTSAGGPPDTDDFAPRVSFPIAIRFGSR
jgi:hypothetical protein